MTALQPGSRDPKRHEQAVSNTAAKFKEKVKLRTNAENLSHLTMGDMREQHRLLKDDPNVDEVVAMQDSLLAYYKSPEGMAELRQAPQWLRDKSIDDLVELLMGDVRSWSQPSTGGQ